MFGNELFGTACWVNGGGCPERQPFRRPNMVSLIQMQMIHFADLDVEDELLRVSRPRARSFDWNVYHFGAALAVF